MKKWLSTRLALQESPKTSPKHYENDVFGPRTEGTREREGVFQHAGAFREVGVELRPKKSLEPSSATRYYGASGKRQPDLTGSRGGEARSHIDVRMSARRAGGASGATGYHLHGCPVVRCGDGLEEREAACRRRRCRCGLWPRNWGRIGGAIALQASAGASGTRTTAAANAQANDGQLVALRPS